MEPSIPCHRPSKYGEAEAYGQFTRYENPNRIRAWRMQNIALQCPECLKEFPPGQYDKMGHHLESHREMSERHKNTRPCKGKCGRFLFIKGWENLSDAKNHERICCNKRVLASSH